jgi:integrase
MQKSVVINQKVYFYYTFYPLRKNGQCAKGIIMRTNEAKWIESRQRWQINVQKDGKRRTFTSYKKNSQPENLKGKIEAEKKADKWLDENTVDENRRCEFMLDRWLGTLEGVASKSHNRQSKGFVNNWLKPVVGMKKIGKVTKADWQECIDNAYRKKELSKKTLEDMRSCITAFVSYCMDCNATRNYPKKLRIPKSARRSDKQILSPDDLDKLFSVTTTTWRKKTVEDFYIHAYRFAVLTGLRPGELIGIDKNNIKGDVVKIKRSINSDKEETQGKNRNAIRSFKLGQFALDVLKDQENMLRECGCISPHVFPDKHMERIVQKNFYRAWGRYCAANNFETIITPYELRHTWVSINDDMPEGLKKKLVGHSKNMDTEGVYGHQKKGDLERAAGYTDAAFERYIGTRKSTHSE